MCRGLDDLAQWVRRKPRLTRAAELLALDLADAFVGEAARASTACAAGLDRIGAEVVSQPLEIAVTDKWVLSQMTVARNRQR